MGHGCHDCGTPNGCTCYEDDLAADRKSKAYITKDSGKRESLANGMVRDTEDGKLDYTLVFDGPMFQRWAGLLTRGAVKYEARNWMKALASTVIGERGATKARYLRSATRHFVQWLRGDTDEDHAAGVFFNINGYEAMKETDPK